MIRWVDLPYFGIRVSPLTSVELRAELTKLIREGKKHAVGNHNLHSLYIHQIDATFADFYRICRIILTDGFPIVALSQIGRKRNPYRPDLRVGSLDWIRDLSSVEGCRKVAIVGASTRSNADAVAALASGSPSIEFKGIPGSDWTLEKQNTVVSSLAEFGPEIVLVGLGMPLQERFLLEEWRRLPDAIYAPVGGAIDQVSGAQKAVPRWAGGIGLEWLWRFAGQPRRLFRRYVVEPGVLVGIVAKRLLMKSR